MRLQMMLKLAVACVLHATGMVALFRYLNRRKVKILLYHGVMDATPGGMLNSEDLHIPRQAFERQIAYLARRYRVLPLRECVERLQRGERLPDYSVALTFDDGYLNNYQHAFPVLRRYNVPATFFVTTSFISSNELLWLDKLEYLVHRTPKRTVSLPLTDGAATYSLASDRDRRRTLKALKRRLKTLPCATRAAAWQALQQQLDVPYVYEEGYYCNPLSWPHLRDMATWDGITIGSHAVHHDNLETLEPAQIREELSRSRAALQEQLGTAIEAFAYPGGTYNERIKQLVQEAGYRWGVTTRHGFNDAATDLLALRRNEVGNRGNLLLFKATVSGALDGLKALFPRRG